jgi:endonuclease/exonuclease/phosphatase (EEP) superfamily protein YafD
MYSRRRLLLAGLLLLTGLTIAPLLAGWVWFLGLIEHFRPFLALGATGLAVLGWRQRRVLALGGAGLVLLNLLIVGSGWARPLAPNGTLPSFSLMHLNVDRHNPDLAHALAYINQQQPDILFLQEVTPENLAPLNANLAGYDLVLAEPRANTHGSALFLRPTAQVTDVSAEIIYLPAALDRPLLQAYLEVAGQRVSLLSFHVIRPRSAWTVQAQAAEIAGAAAWSRAQQASGARVVIVGDFNATPWSAAVRGLRRDGALHLAGSTPGRWATWPGFLPFLPIDLALGSAGIRFVGYERGPAVGSDHRPVLYRWQVE